jgi:hypothetical protein
MVREVIRVEPDHRRAAAQHHGKHGDVFDALKRTVVEKPDVPL